MSRTLPSVVLLTTLTASVALVPPAASASPGDPLDCNALTPLTAFAANLYSCTSAETRTVVAYDHRRKLWETYRLVPNGASCKLEAPDEKNRPEKNAEGAPLLLLKENEPLVAAVFNTHPLVYAAARKEAKEEDVEELESLQLLASLLGNVAAAAITPSTVFLSGLVPPADTDSVVVPRTVAPPPPLPQTFDPLPTSATDAVEKWAKDHAKALAGVLTPLRAAAGAAEVAVGKLGRLDGQATGFLQAMELAVQPAADLPAEAEVWAAFANIEARFDALQKDRSAAAEFKVRCAAAVNALAGLIEIRIGPDPATPLEERALIKSHTGLLTRLETDKLLAGNCGAAGELPFDGLAELRAWFRQDANTPNRYRLPLRKGEGVILKNLRDDALLVMAGRAAQRDTLVKTVDKALANRFAAVKTSSRLTQLAKRVELVDASYGSGTFPQNDFCRFAAGAFEIPIPSRGANLTIQLDRGKLRTESFDLVADSPFKDRLTLDLPSSLTPSYQVRRPPVFNLGVDFGLIYTDLKESSWEAVTDPEDTGDSPRKLIQKTSETSRAGEAALFASFTPWPRKQGERPVTLGLQLGAGLDTDEPAIFVGAVVGLGKYFKIGAGKTWQEVPVLADGQTEGVTVVESTEAIRLGDDFEDEWYFSLTISLSELPFFKPAE